MNPSQTLDARFRLQVARAPGAAAFLTHRLGRSRPLTYGALDAQVDGLARQLQAQGIGPGERVLLLEPVSPRLYALLLALFRLAVTAVLPDPAALSETLEAACRQTRPRAMIGPARAQLLRLTAPALRRIPLALCSDLPLPGTPRLKFQATPGTGPTAVLPPGEPAPALVSFTSGSSGAPKAVPRSHAKLLAQESALSGLLDIRPGEPCLTTLPLFALAILAAGGTVVTPPGGRSSPRGFLRRLERASVSTLIASPPLLRSLAGQGRLPPLRQLFTGGALVEPPLLRALGRALPATRVVAVYGASEAEPIAALEAREVTERQAALWREGAGAVVGRPLPQVRLALLPSCPDRNSETQAFAGPGEVGEILVSGDHVIKETAAAGASARDKLRCGPLVWHRTGDAGYLDGEGLLWIVGRASQPLGPPERPVHALQAQGLLEDLLPGEDLAVLPLGREILLVLAGRLGARRRAVEDRLRGLGTLRIVEGLGPLPRERRHRAKLDLVRLRRRLPGLERAGLPALETGDGRIGNPPLGDIGQGAVQKRDRLLRLRLGEGQRRRQLQDV